MALEEYGIVLDADYMVTPKQEKPKKKKESKLKVTAQQFLDKHFGDNPDAELVDHDMNGVSFDYAAAHEKALQASGYFSHPYSSGDPHPDVEDQKAMLRKKGLIK